MCSLCVLGGTRVEAPWSYRYRRAGGGYWYTTVPAVDPLYWNLSISPWRGYAR